MFEHLPPPRGNSTAFKSCRCRGCCRRQKQREHPPTGTYQRGQRQAHLSRRNRRGTGREQSAAIPHGSCYRGRFHPKLDPDGGGGQAQGDRAAERLLGIPAGQTNWPVPGEIEHFRCLRLCDALFRQRPPDGNQSGLAALCGCILLHFKRAPDEPFHPPGRFPVSKRTLGDQIKLRRASFISGLRLSRPQLLCF